ncbi:MAG: hypothetical protein ACD_81C00189G0006 [uncultured bacterium]|nr:MAG: hypothetical protein ACD_81C00189G0006 [uncultured bacterium]
MKYLAKESVLCFSREDLAAIFKTSKIPELVKEMEKRGASLIDLQVNPILMEEITNAVGDRGAADRDEHEVFAALFIFAQFYEPTCEICFEVNRNFNPNNPQISTLADLNRFRQGINTSDFLIKSRDGFRKFELKRYRGEMNTKSIFEFLREKILHYANNLGDTNLLIHLQPTPYLRGDINFHEIHELLQTLGLKFQGEVLISFNQNDEKHILVQVYPGISKNEILIELPSNRMRCA